MNGMDNKFPLDTVPSSHNNDEANQSFFDRNIYIVSSSPISRSKNEVFRNR
jgi:hypothetical protein